MRVKNNIWTGFKRREVWIHITLIVLFLAVPVLSSPDFHFSLDIFQVRPFLETFSGFVLMVVFFYVHYYVLLPKLLERKRIALYVASISLILIFSAAVVTYAFSPYVPSEMFEIPGKKTADLSFQPDPNTMNAKHFWHRLAELSAPFGLIVFFSVSLTNRRKARNAELERARSELLNLRYQL